MVRRRVAAQRSVALVALVCAGLMSVACQATKPGDADASRAGASSGGSVYGPSQDTPEEMGSLSVDALQDGERSEALAKLEAVLRPIVSIPVR